ncbi:conserved protein of unknown function [Ectopseudomonas oleovorans]|uniref:Uncharacterized protein n=1 Tax=Ectopseudomonas oleovorans TaxID=301 RepID=A0A653B561_ECTOL|nr:conserved protein of unknown function [Pseudomonas oleovorans]
MSAPITLDSIFPAKIISPRRKQAFLKSSVNDTILNATNISSIQLKLKGKTSFFRQVSNSTNQLLYFL